MPTETKTMQIKSVKRFVKRVKYRLKLGRASATTPNSAPPATAAADPAPLFSPVLNKVPTPAHSENLTQPASPRSGSSSETLSSSTPHLQQPVGLEISKAGSPDSELPDMSSSSEKHSDEASLPRDADSSAAESLYSAKEAGLSSRNSDSSAAQSELAHSPPSPHASLPHETHEIAIGGSSHARSQSPGLPMAGSNGDVPIAASPPPQHGGTDPFLVDDPDDPMSEDGEAAEPIPPSDTFQSIPPAEEISLARPSSPPDVSLLSPNVNVNKDVPPPPVPDSDEDEDDNVPELYVPGLIVPTMFLPIPNTDPLSTLLTKYISAPAMRPVRDLSGEWQHSDFHTLVMSNNWRALARMARDRIVTTDPEDLTLILGLWYLRLSSLSRMRLFNQTSAECTNLFAVLNAVEPQTAREYLFDRILPFELEVMQSRTKYWAGDHMGYLDALYALFKKCKTKGRLSSKPDPASLSMWQERGSRICLIIASQLIEMKGYPAAAKLLEPLCKQEEGVTSPALLSSIARIYLQGGYLAMASKHFAAVAADPEADQSLKDMDTALLAAAQGDWTRASEALRKLLVDDPENYAAVNNLSVALLSQGRLKEGIDVLEAALHSSPSSVVVAEPFLFNLSTLYELRSVTAVDKKRDLLIEVAKWSGDGLKTACLKMPSN